MRNLLMALAFTAATVTLLTLVVARPSADGAVEIDRSVDWLPPTYTEVLAGRSAEGVEVVVRGRSHREATWRFLDLNLAKRLDATHPGRRFVEVLVHNGGDHEIALVPGSLSLTESAGAELDGEVLQTPDPTASGVRALMAAHSGQGGSLQPGEGRRFLVSLPGAPRVGTCLGGRYGGQPLRPALASTEGLNHWLEDPDAPLFVHIDQKDGAGDKSR